ncbi:MAG: GNAT family N-acetyltransferase [Candidatus Gribaldobacteria bacterium]|nr:GNAT family N-acetyltransferase [Candidatus Gribaldobacteria bacterium]
MTSSYIETDIKKCELLWEEFSPKQSLFDLWNFRWAFYVAYQYQPYFIVLQENSQNSGLLPLWYEKEKNKYFWFGSWWQEDNYFWLKNPADLPHLLALCPLPACLNGIIFEKIADIIPEQEKDNFQPDDPKYILELDQVRSFEYYLAGLKKERRKAIKKDLFLIEKQNPEIILDNFNDFDALVALSKQRFINEKEDKNDPWYDPALKDIRRVEALRNIIKYQMPQQNYQVKMITVKINQKIAGVDLVAIFNNCYYALVGGYDTENFPGIGNYLNMLNIKGALDLGLKKVDALQSDCGWKHRWYQEKPLYYFSKE